LRPCTTIRRELASALRSWSTVACLAALAGPLTGTPPSTALARPPSAAPLQERPENAVERIVREWSAQREASQSDGLRRLALLGRKDDVDLLARTVQELTLVESRVRPLLIEALSALPRERLRALASARLRVGAPQLERQLLLLVLGRAGFGADLELCLELGRGPGAGDADQGELALQTALTSIAARDTGLWDTARRLAPTATPEVQRLLVRCAGVLASAPPAGEAHALAFLGWCHARLASVRLESLSEIQRASSLACEHDEELLAILRESLRSRSEEALADVALTLGRFEDSEAVPQLIELLAHATPGVRTNAHWSRMRISGLQLVPDQTRWQRWHQEELAWWESSWPTAFLQLQSGQNTAVRLALLELGRHRFRRDRLARAVAVGLTAEERTIVQLACAVLTQLGSRAAVGALVDALEHPDDEARQSAWKCLRGLTGLELPAEAEAWRARFPRA